MRRGSSPVLIGRAGELERLRGAIRSARGADRCVVLISGEAGIGKTRLIAELERSTAADPPGGWPVTLIRGGCVDVGESLAYLPVIEVLEGAMSLGGDAAREAVALRRALSGAPEPAPRPVDPAVPASRAASFLRIRELLAGVAADRDLVIVIDDLHWADRSTLDVISFLSRRLVGTGVLLVLAYRSDELSRRHPLKPVLADLERHATLDHIRVEPLGDTEMRAQIDGILGDEARPPNLDRVVRLADGNPFHVEELLSLDADRGLPHSLRDVLDARLDRLDDAARAVVDLAAVIGRDVDARLLAVAADAPQADVGGALRQAVEARILVSSEDGRQYRFRHALVRELVYGEVAPVDRIGAHRRIAVALSDHPELADISLAVAVADRARHWLAAGSEPEAFSALLEAARSAAAATAWAEAVASYEAAVGLWDRLPDPAVVAGATRSSLLEQAAAIAWYEGDARRALGLNRRAQAQPDVAADATRLGRLAHLEAGLLDDLGDLAGEGDAARRSFGLIPAAPPTIDRVLALSRMGLYTVRRGRMIDAAALFEQAIDAAEAIGNQDEVAANLAFLTFARMELGETSRSREAIPRLDEMVSGIGEQVAWSVVATWVPWVWIGLTEYGLAIEYADRLLLDARSRGLDRGVGLWCLAPRALAEFWLGRWDDATATIALQGDYTWGIDAAVHLRSVAAEIAAGRGDLVRARALADDAIEIARTGFPEQAMVARVAAAWVELLDNHPRAALGHVREAWTLAADWEGLVVRSNVLWVGLWACADDASEARSRADSAGLRAATQLGAELAAAVASTMARDDEWLTAADGPRPVLELAAAEAARLDGRDEAATWASLGDRFERLGDLPRSALARQRQAEASLRDRADRANRAEAVRAIRAVLGHAETMHATRLRDGALAVARAARLEPARETRSAEPRTPAVSDRWGLSGREREVLAMLVDGRTNRQIGDALYISEKTASVHVTHIMDKLGVQNRTEAALLAIRVGLNADAGPDRHAVPPLGGVPPLS